ncbi:peptidase M23 [Streptomyces sp. NPDC015125]|uniref:peptidase M23 n=1 Tax=Streptomyces sp. NPDC015125 TaxID=3364938 RepID=UPI0036F9D077
MDKKDVAQAALKATGLVKKGVQLKFAVVALAVFVVGLLLIGLLFPAGSASGASCTDAGAGTDDSSAVSPAGGGHASGSLHQKQISYAKTIDSVAVKLKLPGRATLIALMTAMQESTLQNLDHGDRDSVGLFQQRPFMDWGTKAQIMDPAYAAQSFFEGRGSNSGLMDIPNWQTLPLGQAAQKVQKSAFPKLYAGHEAPMRKLARQAGLNLARAGKSSGSGRKTPAADEGGGGDTKRKTSPCGVAPPSKSGGGGGGGGTFSDGHQTWALHNPRSVAAAIAWAKAHAGSNSEKKWEQRCLAYTAIVYGWQASGVNYAIDHYKTVPKSMRHDKDRKPPPGALMYWDTHHRAGHIAVYLGHNKVASNDILRPGYIDIVDAGLIESKWNADFIGWTPPVFPKAS